MGFFNLIKFVIILFLCVFCLKGGGAFLLEQDKERPEVFTVNVGNLPPGKEALVCLTFAF
jgi:hypothetical protein